MKHSIFGNKMGWPRYFMPRTGFTLFGSIYFLFTFQISLFFLHLVLESACLVLAIIIAPDHFFDFFFLPRLFIPFLMGRWDCMNYLNGAWRIDWLAPCFYFVLVLSRATGLNDELMNLVAHTLVFIFDVIPG